LLARISSAAYVYDRKKVFLECWYFYWIFILATFRVYWELRIKFNCYQDRVSISNNNYKKARPWTILWCWLNFCFCFEYISIRCHFKFHFSFLFIIIFF
jgi:hypothetical protein